MVLFVKNDGDCLYRVTSASMANRSLSSMRTDSCNEEEVESERISFMLNDIVVS